MVSAKEVSDKGPAAQRMLTTQEGEEGDKPRAQSHEHPRLRVRRGRTTNPGWCTHTKALHEVPSEKQLLDSPAWICWVSMPVTFRLRLFETIVIGSQNACHPSPHLQSCRPLEAPRFGTLKDNHHVCLPSPTPGPLERFSPRSHLPELSERTPLLLSLNAFAGILHIKFYSISLKKTKKKG